MIHFAGFTVKIGSIVRQRCAWCGDILEDVDLRDMASPEGSPPWQPWETGALLAVEGNVRSVVAHEDGAPLPPGTCFDARPAHPGVHTFRGVLS